jgi:hypothetical protein
LASVAILGAILLIRKGERSAVQRPNMVASAVEIPTKECA